MAYSDYEPYIVYHKTSNSLKGFAKRKYDKEHETELRDYDSYRAELKKMLSSDEKITPKKWTAEGSYQRTAFGMAEILYQWGIPSICRNGRGTELQYDRWKNQQSATEKGESRSTKEEEICPFAFV